MNTKVRTQLSIMMFLEFYIWGAWAVTMVTYLSKIGFTGDDIGKAYSTTAWAAIVSPFFIGMVADRFFSAEKVLGIAHLLGAGLLYWASTVTDAGMFFWVLLGYALCYMPTVALANAIAFNQMQNPEKEFPTIRVLGTIGWIVAGIVITVLGRIAFTGIEGTELPMRIAAGVSVLMGLYSFSLPNTPPKSLGKKVSISDILGLDALKLMKDFSFSVFVISSLLVSIPLAFYYTLGNLFLNEAGMTDVAGKMTFGQMSEIVFMLIMPFAFARLGVKKMLIIGMLAWAVRYVLFAFGNAESLIVMFYGGILLHGICYDFFFVTGQIYVDNKAPKEIQASAQGFIALVTYGVGMVIGTRLAGVVLSRCEVVDAAGEIVGHSWRQVWILPATMAAVVIVLFAITFKEKAKAQETPAA